jgi:hypothetical protein
MKVLVKIIAIFSLAGTILPAFAVFYGLIGLDQCKAIMAFSALFWLLTGWFLMNQTPKKNSKEV